MRLPQDPSRHLAYAMRVQPENTLDGVEAAIRTDVPPLKARFSPEAPFGVSLHLGGDASKEILQGNRLERFRALLDQQGLYVFTMNGFAYGSPQQAVKEQVHLPDWHDEERLGYTFRLSTILSKLLPDDVDEGSISTSPLGYKPHTDLGMPANWMVFTLNIVRVVQHLVRLREETGKLIHIDVEPVPDGVLANGVEVADFFENWLLRQGPALLADRVGNDPNLAREHILDHVRVCLHTSHVAVSYEPPHHILDRFDALGIKVGKVHVSSAVRVVLPGDEVGRKRIANELAAFDEPARLRPVVQRNADGSLTGYRDLSDALAHINDPVAEEWRIHVHVPASAESFGGFEATQDVTLDTLRFLEERDVTNHLEVEVPMRDKVPGDQEGLPVDLIGRELQWVLDHLDG